MNDVKITFFEKEAFESMPLPTHERGNMLIPVFMMKDGDEFFVINRNRDKKEHYDTGHIKKKLIETNGAYFKLYGVFDDPYNLVQWVKEKKYSFECSGKKGRVFNDVKSLFRDCGANERYGKGFVDFGGNIREVSCAFQYRIYDIAMVDTLKKQIKELALA
jgi:hypothetical protein